MKGPREPSLSFYEHMEKFLPPRPDDEPLIGLHPPGFPGMDPPPRTDVVHGHCAICNAPWTTSFEFADSTCEHVRFKYHGIGRWDVAYVTRSEPLAPLLRDLKNRFGIKVW